MSEVVIRAEGLGKAYALGWREPYQVLRDVLAHPLAALRGQGGATREPFWALRDVSFEVERGDAVGIVGPNGAGKSTLLKVLTRITRPTAGWAEVRGRIGSLLEVGTGFNLELSGRDNVYLSGAILGMRKQEIDRKFDEIVAFAEVESFIDVPVKFYSSGMYVRIGFAVAAHLEPDILIVDEVLAVGDLAFQQKCIAKMGAVARDGRTVLFVSHDMGAVNALCRTALRIEGGRLAGQGAVGTVTDAYMTDQLARADVDPETGCRVDARVLAKQDGADLAIERVELANPLQETAWAATGDPLVVRLHYRSAQPLAVPWFGLRIEDPYGNRIIDLSTGTTAARSIGALRERGCVELLIESLPLVGGRYALSLSVGRGRKASLQLDHVAEFHVRARDVYGDGFPIQQPHGLVVAAHRWTHSS